MNTDYIFIADLNAEVQIPQNGILSRTLHNDQNLKVVLFGFAPGQELSAHTAPMPASLYFVQGESELTLGNDTMPARAGTFVHMQPNLQHGIVAKSATIMLLLMMKQQHTGA
jgi:quercetin dioxygenase-like cupin family protein